MTSETIAPTPRSAVRHSLVEDVLGILLGSFVVSLGLFLLQNGGAVTGGTAGLSLLLSYAIPVHYGVLFAALNLPFFLFSARGKGWDFTLRSASAIILVLGFSLVHPKTLGLGELDAGYAAVAGNILCGVGILILFRHKSSMGGFNIIALILQDRFGFRAGYVLMALDIAIVVSSLTVVAPLNALISASGAILLNLILALNHRPGRYQGE